MGTRGLGDIFSVSGTLSNSRSNCNIGLKGFSSSEERGDSLDFCCRETYFAEMEHDSKLGPIPSGWSFKIVVLKDGSRSPCYYCPETGQHFYSYNELTRYVNYAMEAQLGIYALNYKSLKLKNKAGAAKLKKEFGLSRRKRKYSSTSSSKSSTVVQGKETMDMSETSDPDYGSEEKSSQTGSEFKDEEQLPDSESTEQDEDDSASA
ncbi:ATPase 10, plasma membrane-type-like protein [Quillaja saponaria]|uniref:ATPase 10, plasma membrane-type-like protein n=1 Tax=Quillaja saponaria TaxID=32244 RepID=A0AAD7PDN6_QUISA|nr:ATPase 10, plasma membrane-type-like protein [Quillaja saponaria]